MTDVVRRVDANTVRLRLQEYEVQLLRTLPEGVRALLDDPDTDDPVVKRLFPACVPDDDASDAEVRELLFPELLEERLAGLDAVADILERVRREDDVAVVDLTGDEPELVLGVINDVRLTLGYRVGLDHLEREDIDAEHPAAPAIAIMDHLAWLQTQLLRVIDPAV